MFYACHYGAMFAFHERVYKGGDGGMMKTMIRALRQNDFGVLPRWPHVPAHAILGLILFTSLLSWGLGYSSFNWPLLTFGIWGTYGLLFLFSNRITQPFLRDLSQSIITISIIMSLYFLLGHLGFAVIPWDGDQLVAGIDQLLGGGRPPVVMISNRLSPWVIESCAFAYALFIPYLYLSIFLCLLGRSDEERPMFVTALAITYAVSFAGYLLLPAHGPLVYNRADFSGPLQGGYFLDLVVNADLSTGGPYGAFPSLHVGASWLLCFFDLRRRQLRGMLYVPLVLAISVAILVLRFHYLTDLLVGFLIATMAVLAAERIYQWPVPEQSIWTNGWRRFLGCYYGSIQVRGAHYVPEDTPVLVLSNHCNAFIDPFILRVALKRPLRLTAKAALLNNPLLAWIIRMFGIVTFARIQDRSTENRQQVNSEAFQHCFQALDGNEVLCVFPEGRSHSEPSMLPLKSGAARLTLEYLADASRGRQLRMIPVGIFYEAKEQFGSRVLVEIGSPMVVNDWLREHGPGSVRKLSEEFHRRLEALTLNFQDERSMRLLPWVSELYQYREQDPAALDRNWCLPERFVQVTGRFIAAYRSLRDEPKVCDLEREASELQEQCHRLGVRVEELNLPMHPGKALLFLVRELEILTMGSLLFFVGMVLNLPAILITMMVVKAISEDRDHWATNFLFCGAGLLLLWLAVASGLLAVWVSPAAAAFLVPAALFSGYFSLRYLQRIRRTARRARTFLLFLFHPGLKSRLQEQCRTLTRGIDQLYSAQQAGDNGEGA